MFRSLIVATSTVLVGLGLTLGGCGAAEADQTLSGTSTTSTTVMAVDAVSEMAAPAAAEPCGFCEIDGTVHRVCDDGVGR